MEDSTIGTVKAAEMLNVTRQWILKLIKNGELEAVKIGRDWRVDRTSALAYAARRTPTGPPAAKESP